MPITHAFVSAKSDGSDDELVRPSDWNADHVGNAGGFYFDGLPLHSTHGDEFDEASLNARWTPQGSWDSDAVQYAVGDSWLQLVGRGSLDQSIFQAMPNKETFEVILAMDRVDSGGIIYAGPAIVSATGTGVMASFRTDESIIRTMNLTSYASPSAGNTMSVGALNSFNLASKHWWSLRRVLSALDGEFYSFRYSFNGFTWIREFIYDPTPFTATQIGWGRFGGGGASGDLLNVDRFNVIDDLDQGNNLIITPSSGTATYTASSAVGGFGAGNAADGTSAAWAAATGGTDNPLYWQCAWSVGQSLNRVLIKERGAEAFGLAHVELYDGATTTKVPLCTWMTGAGTWYIVDFPTLTGITQLRIVGDGGATGNTGFTEVEAYLRS